MKSKNSMRYIIHSLLWAVAIVGSSLLLADTEIFEEIYFILTALWFSSFLMLQDEQAVQAEWQCIQRFFNRFRRVER